jgi:peptidoglycan/LPS O-acetylase OafA/YrhL
MQSHVEPGHPATTASPTSRFGRLEPLTGLRGVAACAVLIAHAIDISFQYSGVAIFHPAAARLAYFGMALFFVLSGFVIHYNYASSFANAPLSRAAYRFFVARFARLYPLYLISLAVSLSYIPPRTFGIGVILAYLTLTQSWLNEQMATFPPDWSISAEWFFYFAFVPLTFAVASLRRPTWALALLCGPGMIALALSLRHWRPELTEFTRTWFWHRDAISSEPWLWFSYYSPYLRLLEFITGVLAAKAYMTYTVGGPAPLAVRLFIYCATAWCAAIIIDDSMTAGTFLESTVSNFVFAPVLAPLMLCLCRYDSSLGRLLSTDLAKFLGEISYSIYIWSFFVMTMMSGFMVSDAASPLAYLNSTVKMIAIMGLTIVFAYGSYVLIEAPSRRWIRAALAGKK